MHDPDVSRTTDGTGLVSEMTLDEIRTLGVPTLEEALRYDQPVGEGDVASEPATVVESGRAADVLAHLAAELARPAGRP